MTEELKEFEQSLGRFFDDLGFRFEIFEQTKREYDLLLSSDFDVFDYIAPDENRLSDIIRDLLDPKGKHGQRDIFLNLFLERFEIEDKGFSKFERELTIEKGRIDIFIKNDDGTYAIIIENKPWTWDQEKQIARYCEYGEKKFQNNYVAVYISKDGSPPSEYSIPEKDRKKLEEEAKLITISYCSGIRDWIQDCYEKCKSDKFRHFLLNFKEYIEKYFKEPIALEDEDER